MFLAQVFNVDLSLSSCFFIVTMSVAASIGSPATPGAGIIILSMVLEGVGIPAAGIALILGVDRILDMLRTSVNVLGDVVAWHYSAILYSSSQYARKANHVVGEKARVICCLFFS